jgi:hypothetical protein
LISTSSDISEFIATQTAMVEILRRGGGRNVRFAVDHRTVDLGGATYSVEDAREFDEHAVGGVLDDPAVMLSDLRLDKLASTRLETLVSTFFVRARLASPRASAPSVPGRTPSQMSALLASPTRRGSTTINRMPRFSASIIAVACVSRVLLGL